MYYLFFFFQAEDGIRDKLVTGVQTCALPICRMKRLGFSDRQLGELRASSEEAMRQRRWELGIHPVYKTVDTCAGEFPSSTPYLYSTYDACVHRLVDRVDEIGRAHV